MPITPDAKLATEATRVLGRYALYGEIASGGMASVHLARLMGTAGFTRTVAIKRLHKHLAGDPEFVAMFLDEARLAARIRHPNVIPTLDVVATEGELFLVMEYVQGESLHRLFRETRAAKKRIPPSIAVSIACDILHGLHAAHEAKNERGEPLGLVHRDVSPQNVLVGVDGVARVFDFGIAKALGRLQTTTEGQLKGKISYMAPEQIRQGDVSRRTDVFAASIILWEALAGRKLFEASNEGELVLKIVEGTIPPLPSDVPPELERAVKRGLELDPENRFPTAHEMARALESSVAVVTARAVGEWMQSISPETLADRAAQVERIENLSSDDESRLVAMVARGAEPAVQLEPLDAPPRWSKEAETVVAPTISDPDSDSPVVAESPRGARSRGAVVLVVSISAVAAFGGIWLGLRDRVPQVSEPVASAPPAVATPVEPAPPPAPPSAETAPPTAPTATASVAVTPPSRSKPAAARPSAAPAPSAPHSKNPEDFFGRD